MRRGGRPRRRWSGRGRRWPRLGAEARTSCSPRARPRPRRWRCRARAGRRASSMTASPRGQTAHLPVDAHGQVGAACARRRARARDGGASRGAGCQFSETGVVQDRPAAEDGSAAVWWTWCRLRQAAVALRPVLARHGARLGAQVRRAQGRRRAGDRDAADRPAARSCAAAGRRWAAVGHRERRRIAGLGAAAEAAARDVADGCWAGSKNLEIF